MDWTPAHYGKGLWVSREGGRREEGGGKEEEKGVGRKEEGGDGHKWIRRQHIMGERREGGRGYVDGADT